MSKPKKVTRKTNKVLVRNSATSVRPSTAAKKTNNVKKVRFVKEAAPAKAPAKTTAKASAKAPAPAPVEEKNQLNDFTSPEFFTLLQLADEIKKVSNAQGPTYSLPNGPKNSKNLDFLPEEKLFQDLVELETPDVHETRSQPCVRVTSKKDPEPDFNKYLKYTLEPEYFFPSYVVPVVESHKSVFNGRSDYNKLKLFKEEVEHF